MAARFGFARWRSEAASGGNRYDETLVAALRRLDLDLHEYAVAGPWPLPDASHRDAFADLLRHERRWLVNNIIASAAPEAISAATDAGRHVAVLMHYFPSDDPALSGIDRARLAASEAAAVAAASTVIATSEWSARQIAQRYGRGDALVALPGVAPASLSPGSEHWGGPPALLWLGRLTETKDPLTFVDALALVRDLPWSARLVGPDALDPPLTRAVLRRIAHHGLAERVEVAGARSGAQLEQIWARSDLLVHTSRAETYGMVVAEALARGIPSIVALGTGAVEAQRGAGGTCAPGDAAELAIGLRRWLSDTRLRRRWRARANELRAEAPTWEAAARVVERGATSAFAREPRG